LHDNPFSPNSYPHFHQLEFQNTTDALEFDDDYIASTNEINYQHSKFQNMRNLKMMQTGASFMDYDADFFRGAIP
jgi:hypothetical protein